MGGMAAVLYGAIVYLLLLGTFLYAVAFVGNLPAPTTIDGGMGGQPMPALLTDVMLLGLFAVQHSVIARPAFKGWWKRIVPPPVERTTWLACASVTLLLLLWHWRPIPRPVWAVTDPATAALLDVLSWLGWGIALVSTFLINHFELLGLRQAYARVRGWTLPPPVFSTPFLYQHVRHPIYFGFLLAVWSAPRMSVGHLLFAVATTGYIRIAIYFEERDLIATFGEPYRRYREQVPMLLPLGTRQFDDAPVPAPPADLRWP
jgi:protein-S-isoprenylcysteine O-methyltransferase Ste14